jgi:ABC-type proline/glycine betaine transport system ATPase subunit
MPKFTVTIEEMVRHTIEIEGTDQEAAGENALEALRRDGLRSFSTEVTEREVVACHQA